jgi:hypothetical protein
MIIAYPRTEKFSKYSINQTCKSLFASVAHQTRIHKNFVKVTNQNSAGFTYMKTTSPRISYVKIKEGLFVGTQIRGLIQDVKFEDQLSEVKKATWQSFQNVTTKFLGSHKAEKYCDKTTDLVQSYKAMGCNMSLNVHFLDRH